MMHASAIITDKTKSTRVPDSRYSTQAFSCFSVLEEVMMNSDASDTESSADARSSTTTVEGSKRKSCASMEELEALQTCTNTLYFKTAPQYPSGDETRRGRSASLSLPSSSSSSGDNIGDLDPIVWRFNFGRRGGRWFPRTHAMRLQKVTAVEQEERVWNFSRARRVVGTDTVPEELRTTVMLRGIPKDYTRDDILCLLQDHDFGDINFLYLLLNKKHGGNAGYCFINFRFPHDAGAFKSSFTGLVFPKKSNAEQEEPTHVGWRYPIQGFASHFDQFRHSDVTHGNIPAGFRPTLIRDGKVVQFPEVWDKGSQKTKKTKKTKKKGGK